MITQRYNLNLIPDKVPVIVNCSQYDALSRTIEMVLFDGSVLYTIASGVTATVRGTKQDNTGFEYPCTINESTVSFNIQDQMTIFAGRVPCEIRLIDSNGIIGTCNFLLNVEETPLDPGITISESDLPLLESAEQNAIRSEEAADRSEDEADRAEAEADRAERAVANAVKSVNGELPDANGNVDVVALPDGGTQGQYLVKQSSTDGDADWQTLPTFVQTVNNVAPTNGNVNVETLPTGGTQGQVLTKQSSTDGDADWETISIPSVDQTYNASSTNAQSGTAIAEALSGIETLPSGGSTNQVLTKKSSTDGDVIWKTPYSGLTFTSLWTNSSATSEFAAQTVSLSLSGYAMVIVVVKQVKNQNVYTLHPLFKSNTYNMCGAYNNGFKSTLRTANVSNTGITFGAGYITDPTFSSGSDSDNGVAIPYRIYGVK